MSKREMCVQQMSWRTLLKNVVPATFYSPCKAIWKRSNWVIIPQISRMNYSNIHVFHCKWKDTNEKEAVASSCKFITPADCDVAFHQFLSLLKEKSTTFLASFKEFQSDKVCLDDFFFRTLQVGSSCKALANVLKLIFTLSHGQPTVEGGFSTNSSILFDNMKECSLILWCLMQDYLVSRNLKPL